MGWDFDREFFALLRAGSKYSLDKTSPGDRRHPHYRPEQVDQRGEVVGPHVEDRSATRLVVELRVRMPTFRAGSQHECRSAQGLADGPVINQFASRLLAASEKCVRGTAQPDVISMSGLQQLAC